MNCPTLLLGSLPVSNLTAGTPRLITALAFLIVTLVAGVGTTAGAPLPQSVPTPDPMTRLVRHACLPAERRAQRRSWH